jgi:hypothetical protein
MQQVRARSPRGHDERLYAESGQRRARTLMRLRSSFAPVAAPLWSRIKSSQCSSVSGIRSTASDLGRARRLGRLILRGMRSANVGLHTKSRRRRGPGNIMRLAILMMACACESPVTMYVSSLRPRRVSETCISEYFEQTYGAWHMSHPGAGLLPIAISVPDYGTVNVDEYPRTNGTELAVFSVWDNRKQYDRERYRAPEAALKEIIEDVLHRCDASTGGLPPAIDCVVKRRFSHKCRDD